MHACTRARTHAPTLPTPCPPAPTGPPCAWQRQMRTWCSSSGPSGEGGSTSAQQAREPPASAWSRADLEALNEEVEEQGDAGLGEEWRTQFSGDLEGLYEYVGDATAEWQKVVRDLYRVPLNEWEVGAGCLHACPVCVCAPRDSAGGSQLACNCFPSCAGPALMPPGPACECSCALCDGGPGHARAHEMLALCTPPPKACTSQQPPRRTQLVAGAAPWAATMTPAPTTTLHTHARRHTSAHAHTPAGFC